MSRITIYQDIYKIETTNHGIIETGKKAITLEALDLFKKIKQIDKNAFIKYPQIKDWLTECHEEKDDNDTTIELPEYGYYDNKLYITFTYERE